MKENSSIKITKEITNFWNNAKILFSGFELLDEPSIDHHLSLAISSGVNLIKLFFLRR
jgi:hypothetical protein